MIKLYDYELSGNCYKLRLFLSFLGLEWETRRMDFYPGREHKESWFLQLNPLGQLPIIEDDDNCLRDAQAILVYLATKYDNQQSWYDPSCPEIVGQIGMWLAFADSITASASSARLHDAMFYDFDIVACRKNAHRLFRILDEHLWFNEQKGKKWICSEEQPTIADIACFPYIMLSEEGGISRMPYPAIRRWTDRFKAIPGFIEMSGVFGV